MRPSPVTPRTDASLAAELDVPGRNGGGPPAGAREHRLSRSAVLNAAAAALEFVAFALVELLVNPLLVASLGSRLYGVWRVLWKLTGWLWALGGRSAPALQWAIANRRTTADDEEKRRLVGSAGLVWLVFLPLLAGIGALGAWYAPAFLGAPAGTESEVRLAAALLVGNSILLTLLGLPRAALQGENLGYKRMGLSALLVLFGGALTVIAIELGLGMPGIALANIVNSAMTAVLFWRVASRHVPWFGVARPTRADFRSFLSLSWWATAWKFISEFMAAGDVVLLALFAPIELVTVYTLTKYAADALAALMSNPLQAVTPGFGGIIGSGELGRARRARAEFMSLTWLLLISVGTVIVLFNDAFVDLWVGERFSAGAWTTALIVLTVMQYVLLRTDAYLIDITLNVRPKVLLGVASTAATVAAAAIAVGALDGGIVGICVALLVGRAVVSLGYPWLLGRTLRHPIGAQLAAALRPAVVTAVLLVAGAWAGARIEGLGWPALIAGGIVALPATTTLAAWGGLSAGRREACLRRARRTVRMLREGVAG